MAGKVAEQDRLKKNESQQRSSPTRRFLASGDTSVACCRGAGPPSDSAGLVAEVIVLFVEVDARATQRRNSKGTLFGEDPFLSGAATERKGGNIIKNRCR